MCELRKLQLTRKELKECLFNMNDENKNRIVENYLYSVMKIEKEMNNGMFDSDYLQSVGIIGLLKGINNLESNYRYNIDLFEYDIMISIKKEIQDYLDINLQVS